MSTTSKLSDTGSEYQDAESEESTSPPWPAPPRDEDLNRLALETNACQKCRLMCGPREYWTQHISSDEPQDSFMYHQSYESLLDSVSLGCRICQFLWDKLQTLHHSISDALPIELFISLRGEMSNRSIIHTFQSNGSDSSRGAQMICKFSVQCVSIIHPTLAPPDTNSRFAKVKHWARLCQEPDHHPECDSYRRIPQLKPTRLLQVSTNEPVTIRLVTTEAEAEYTYVTLSHRWGTEPYLEPPKLSEHITAIQQGWISAAQLKAGIAVQTLPKLFRDAIDIIRECDLAYIWIDSLCIIQDQVDGKNPDWQNESRKMGDIYAGGLFNIVATQTTHSDQSLLQANHNRQVFVTSDGIWNSDRAEFEATPAVVNYNIMGWEIQDEFSKTVVDSSLLSRGWVFQEVLLSSANLFCTDTQMWWSCVHGTYSETLSCGIQASAQSRLEETSLWDPIHRAKNDMLSANQSEDAASSWANILSLYTKTSTTISDDRLVAIRGLSHFFQRLRSHQLGDAAYHSGIWSYNIFNQLTWSVTSQDRPPHRLPLTALIPSWSPASVTTTTSSGSIGRLQALLPNQFITWNTCQLDVFGRPKTTEGYILHLQGVLIDISPSTPDILDPLYFTSTMQPTRYEDAPIRVIWDTIEEVEIGSRTSGDAFYKALLTLYDHKRSHLCGLLLRPAEVSTNKDGAAQVWTRCGYFYKNRNISRYPETMEEAELWNSPYDDAFQLSRYGFRVTYHMDESQEFQCVREPNGLALDLEDILII